jgi:glycosyltransferase involved in cell wall biosynthesis
VNGNHRIVLVSGGVKLGGAATFLLNLGGELVRRSVPLQVVSLEHDNPYAGDFERLQVPIHLEDERTTIFEDRVSSVLQVIRRFGPTVVVSCLGASSYEIVRYIPSTVTRLGVLQADAAPDYPVFAAYAPYFDAVIGVSRQIVAKFGSHPSLAFLPAHYLPYGIPLPPHDLARAHQPEEPMRILYLGRLCRPQKRVHLFPEILRDLNAANVPFHWTIAGDGPERAWLQKEMKSFAPNSAVNFPGAINYRDVPHLLDSHDIFLLISDHEGLPLSLLEAMAHGLVPVVSRLPSGVTDVVDEECGILVEPNDTGAYADAIIRLWQEPAVLSAMSARAPLRIRSEHSVEAMADRWLALLDRLNKNDQTKWPQSFSVEGPLNHNSLWFRQPMRSLRRLNRAFSGRSGG